MSENKRMIALFGVVIGIILIIVIIAFWPKSSNLFTCGVKGEGEYSNLASINYEQYECLYQTEEKNAIVVANDLSDEEKEALNEAAITASHAIYYLSSDITDDELQTIKDDLESEDVSYDDHTLVVLESGKVENHTSKISSNDDVYDFLKEAGLVKFICDATPDEEYPNLSNIDYDTYTCLYENEEPFVLIITQTTCSYCKQFKPVINEYAGENNIPVYYLDIDTLSSTDGEALLSSLSYFDENSRWGTPLTLAIEDKEVTATLSGFVDDESRLDSFFESAGLK